MRECRVVESIGTQAPDAATIGRDASCASQGRDGGHPSGGLAVARSERARMPASDERTATVAPLLSPPLPDDHRYLSRGVSGGGGSGRGGAARGAREARSVTPNDSSSDGAKAVPGYEAPRRAC